MMNMKLKRLISALLILALLPAGALAASGGENYPVFLDSETVLVGDSLTCHLIATLLRPNDLLNGASYMAAPNSAVNYYFEDWWPLKPLEQNGYGSETSEGLEGLTFAEAVEATAGKFTRVLFLMGSNSSEYSVVEDYTVVIDHGAGLRSIFYGLTALDVEAGDDVKQGQLLGTSGRTVVAELRIGTVPINPLLVWRGQCDGLKYY